MSLSLIACIFVSFYLLFFFFKQKTAYEMRISDWSSDVCSSDLYGIEKINADGRTNADDNNDMSPIYAAKPAFPLHELSFLYVRPGSLLVQQIAILVDNFVVTLQDFRGAFRPHPVCTHPYFVELLKELLVL